MDYRDLQHTWQDVSRAVEESRDVWTPDDPTRREFEQRYWNEIASSIGHYLDALREMAEAVEGLNRRSPCR